VARVSEPSTIGLLEQDLRRELERGRVVVVVGAGVAVAATRGDPIASWLGLLENGIGRCEQVFLTLPEGWGAELRARSASGEADDLVAVADEVARTLGAPDGGEYRRWLRETVGALEPRDPATIEALHALGVPLLTTNYDSLIERVTGLEAVTWRSGPNVERLLRGDEPGVLHLHGHWEDPESVVLGIRSYDQVLGDAYAQFAPRALSAFNSLLFVGCGEGLQDPNFGALRRWLTEVFAGSEYRHFRLALGGEARAVAAEHGPGERIFIVPYGNGHEDLAPFLRGLRPPSTEPTRPAQARAERGWGRRRLALAAAAAALAILGVVLGIVLTRDGGDGSGGADIALGDTVSTEITEGDEIGFDFTAEEGQRIFLVNHGNPVTGTCEGLDVVNWSLRREDGGQGGQLFDTALDCAYPSGSEGYDLAAGKYRLALLNRGSVPVNVRFTLVDADPDEQEIAIGDHPETGDVRPGVVSTYRFTADRDQRIVLENQRIDGTCDGARFLSWSLGRSEGGSIFENEAMAGCRDPCPPAGCTLTEGEYVLSISGGDQPGRYRFALQPGGSP
jgi:hypothetical protein